MKSYGVQLNIDFTVGEFDGLKSFEEYWNTLTPAEKIKMFFEHDGRIMQERIWRY